MKQISTRADNWDSECEKWAVAREPFRVLNVGRLTHQLIFTFICLHYKFVMSMAGATTAVFDPQSTGKA